MGNARLQDLPVSGRALGSLTQVEAPPRIMTPGGTLQLPHAYGQPQRRLEPSKVFARPRPFNGLFLPFAFNPRAG